MFSARNTYELIAHYTHLSMERSHRFISSYMIYRLNESYTPENIHTKMLFSFVTIFCVMMSNINKKYIWACWHCFQRKIRQFSALFAERKIYISYAKWICVDISLNYSSPIFRFPQIKYEHLNNPLLLLAIDIIGCMLLLASVTYRNGSEHFHSSVNPEYNTLTYFVQQKIYFRE